MTRQERTLQRRLRRQVRRAFSPAGLVWYCTADEVEFANHGEFTDLGYDKRLGERQFYVHADNGGDILGIAHLDTVQSHRFCRFYESTQGTVVKSSALDDRLGAYVICDLLPKLGVKVDWLLTTGEESCQSTADQFTTDKPYRWMFQFDRTGTDVVMYEYDSDENRERLAAVNAQVGEGSFSDICCLNQLGVAGYNWGVGYHDYHSPRGWALLNDTFASVARFLSFVDKFGSESIPHIARPKWWEDEFDDIEGECPACAGVTYGGYCESCNDWTDIASADTGSPARYHGLSESEWRRLQERLA